MKLGNRSGGSLSELWKKPKRRASKSEGIKARSAIHTAILGSFLTADVCERVADYKGYFMFHLLALALAHKNRHEDHKTHVCT